MFFRTDMAVERRDLYKTANKLEDEINGIECEEEKLDDISITRVKIINEEGEIALDKKRGNYITIDVKKINNITTEKEQKIIDIFSKELKEILIVGLGNLYATPDSLGAKVVQNIEITRHIKIYLPEIIDKNTRSVSAITPGVLGTTGIETVEIVKGIVDNIKPKLPEIPDIIISRKCYLTQRTIKASKFSK